MALVERTGQGPEICQGALRVHPLGGPIELHSNGEPWTGSGEDATWQSYVGASRQEDSGGKSQQAATGTDHNSVPTVESIHRHVEAVSSGKGPSTHCKPPQGTGQLAMFQYRSRTQPKNWVHW